MKYKKVTFRRKAAFKRSFLRHELKARVDEKGEYTVDGTPVKRQTLDKYYDELP